MTHPYKNLPDSHFWLKEKGISEPSLLDPVGSPPFSISRADKIVSAGSCFAQNIAPYCKHYGFNYFITEQANDLIAPDIARSNGYGVFSARYGNIYTAKQLLQLIQRTYGKFDPIEFSWAKTHPHSSERIIDPFRPGVQLKGFLNNHELSLDREIHFRKIRQAFEEMDVFIFTLGLTEAWIDKRDGAVFPIAPGVLGGSYNADTIGFQNFGVEETSEDLIDALNLLRIINPDLRIILTVSPVPLNATFEDRHVLLSTTLSKSILRVAAENAINAFKNIAYFPSFEIITSPHVRGAYYRENCREINAEGVSHVMRLLFSRFSNIDIHQYNEFPNVTAGQKTNAELHRKSIEQELELLCDEEGINNQ